jgi:hypothetical protein
LVPADGPPAWTSGTLFPQSSRKTARAINAASNNQPLVVLANLSGFDRSPESMRMRQLEYGAEIGRAVTNFKGPIVFGVVSRYHGGAFVVFSRALNESMVIAAVEGSVASVIGGTPAAATVFARDVKLRTEADPWVRGRCAAGGTSRSRGRADGREHEGGASGSDASPAPRKPARRRRAPRAYERPRSNPVRSARTSNSSIAIERWGSNLGVRLPAAVAEAARLHVDQRVRVSVEGRRSSSRRSKLPS